jgi:predicted nucleic acid-binding protein
LPISDQQALLRDLEQRTGHAPAPVSGELYGEPLTDEDIERTEGEAVADKKAADLATLAIELVAVSDNLELVRKAAKLKASKKMAYADCFAAALAKLRNVEVVTGDPEFKEVEGEVKVAWLPRN